MNNKHLWQDPLLDISKGGMSRKEAYKMMQGPATKRIGLGPAYYTKLIFFFLPSSGVATRGYIMDQWTATSTNLLLGQRLIKLSNGWVNHKNTCEIYEAYCTFVEELAHHYQSTPELIERQLFSNGGRGNAAGEWRRHVKQARR